MCYVIQVRVYEYEYAIDARCGKCELEYIRVNHREHTEPQILRYTLVSDILVYHTVSDLDYE